MLMALYNVSISIKGLKHISERPGLLPLIWNLLNGKRILMSQQTTRFKPNVSHHLTCACLPDGDWEVCLHTVRLLQSVLLEGDVLLLQDFPVLGTQLQARVSQLTSSMRPSLRLAAQQTLEDLRALQEVQYMCHICSNSQLISGSNSSVRATEHNSFKFFYHFTSEPHVWCL